MCLLSPKGGGGEPLCACTLSAVRCYLLSSVVELLRVIRLEHDRLLDEGVELGLRAKSWNGAGGNPRENGRNGLAAHPIGRATADINGRLNIGSGARDLHDNAVQI